MGRRTSDSLRKSNNKNILSIMNEKTSKKLRKFASLSMGITHKAQWNGSRAQEFYEELKRRHSTYNIGKKRNVMKELNRTLGK